MHVALAIASLALIVVFVMTACGGPSFSYLASGREYTSATVGEVARLAESPSFKGKPTSNAAELRHDMLVDLRSKGGTEEDLATLLTDMFPGEACAVPYFAEEAVFEGQTAWVVVEVWGTEDGRLDSTRLWVFDRETGDVLLSEISR